MRKNHLVSSNGVQTSITLKHRAIDLSPIGIVDSRRQESRRKKSKRENRREKRSEWKDEREGVKSNRESDNEKVEDRKTGGTRQKWRCFLATRYFKHVHALGNLRKGLRLWYVAGGVDLFRTMGRDYYLLYKFAW